MSVLNVFAQLEQAYILVGSDPSEPLLVNAKAALLTGLDITTSQGRDTWLNVLLPAIETARSVKNTQVYLGQKAFLLCCSEIQEAGQLVVAVHFSRPELSDAERQNFYAMLDNLGAYVYCKDVNYNYTYANKQVCELFELNQEDIVGANDCQLFDEATGRKMIEQIDSRVIEQGITLETEERNYVQNHDEYRDYLTVKKPLFDETGAPLGLFGISMDISELKQTQKRLYISEQRLSTILDNVGAYIFIKDKERRFQYANKQTEALFRLQQHDIIGKNNFDLLGEEQGEEFDRTDREVFESGERVDCLESFATPDKVYYYWTVKIPLQNEAGEIDSYIGLSTDITEQKRLENQIRSYNDALQTKIKEVTDLKDNLEYQATHDVLTGLFNRRMLETLSEQIFVPENTQLVGMLMLDLDRFKRVNDEFGHKKGDDVIRLLAQLMTEECRSSDVICRYGGEEFILLMPGALPGKALSKAEWLRKRYKQVAKEEFPFMGELTLSVGVSEAPANKVSFEQLYLAADKALYKAKENGRNCCAEGTIHPLPEVI